MMNFHIHALPADTFAPLFALSDDALRARNIRSVTADDSGGFPCRVSLQDASEGERLLLLPYAHHQVDTPYRASGPIYIREAARQASPAPGEVPELLRRRTLSARAYDADGMMAWAEVVQGIELETAIDHLFAIDRVAYIHIHYASPGCYACRIDRVE